MNLISWPRWICLFLLLLFTLPSQSASLDYYLPEGTAYDPAIPTPQTALGYHVGDWHVRHDQMVAYLKTLAQSSDRITLETIGRTYEQRELLVLTVTAPANHSRLEQIRRDHLNLSQPNVEPDDTGSMPVVLYMGYSVHGDESSGGNAALLVAYHLAAAQGPEMDDLLKHSVILLDPCLNPDGFNRFAQWANSHRGKHPVADDAHREHAAVWPAGRGNHYWFDLNRDWLLLQHPESQARIKVYHHWKPNLHTDFHEMGSHSTFFFQPGVPERRNPLTPEKNVRLTEQVAAFHAKALDAIGSLYYTEERFDDYYYGKGSTYPDINGAVGVLFEQASTRGHLRESPHGEFDFAFTIRNQFRTSLSSFAAALEHRVELLDYQRQFYEEAMKAARQDDVAGYVFGDPDDPVKNLELLRVLLQHQIKVHRLSQSVRVPDGSFDPDSAYWVPSEQPQYRLARTILERQTNFPDNIFYDVSGWTFPLAMGIPHAPLQNVPDNAVGERVMEINFRGQPVPPDAAAYAYAFSWNSHYAPRALYRLLDAEVRARVADRPFASGLDFERGTIVIPMGIQDTDRETIHGILKTIATEDGVKVQAISSGLTPRGIDLGSPSLRPLKKPVPAILVGSGLRAYEAGEAWHLLDHRYDMKVSLLELDALGGADLHDYTHLIMVDGAYSKLGTNTVEKIKSWIHRGGVLIAIKKAAQWAADQKLAKVEFKKEDDEDSKETEKKKAKDSKETNPKEEPKKKDPPKRFDYGHYEKIEHAKNLSGALFQVDLDVTHPLGYGYTNRLQTVFRNSRLYMKPSTNPYGNVAVYTENPVQSGYVHEEELGKLKGTASIISEKRGKGTVILMVDNPNFRAYTHGTTKLFLNALFFGDVIVKTKE